MPRYKFTWANFDDRVLRGLCQDLDLDTDDPAKSLRQAFGARPKEEFVRQTWPYLRERWLGRDGSARRYVVGSLWESGLGRGDGERPTGKAAEMEYLRARNNAEGLRTTVWSAFLWWGEGDDAEAAEDRSAPIRGRRLATVAARFVNEILYPRRGTRLSAEETDLELMVDEIALRGWEVNPGQQRALVYYGGNGEGLDWLVEPMGSIFPDHTCYLLAYRGYGASQGTPSEPVLTSDALAVFDHAAARHRGSVDVLGRSLGSAVAMQVAARRRVRRLVLITPFDSVAALAAEGYPRLLVRQLLRDRWDSAAVAHEVRAPVLVVRAGRDEVVSPAATDRLLAALPAEPQVLNLSRRDHNTVEDAPAFWPTIVEFLAP